MNFLTPSEIATTLGVDRSTITRWVRLGSVKSIRLPSKEGKRGLIRIEEQEVRRLLMIKGD